MNKVNYINIGDLNNLLLKKLSSLPRNFDLIVGLPESGLIPANLIALYLNRPLTDLYSFMNSHIYSAGKRGGYFVTQELKRVLIVDDVVQSGATIKATRKALMPFANNYDISYCAVYVVKGKEAEVDYYFDTIDIPFFSQWHLLRYGIREKAQFTQQLPPYYTKLEEFPFLLAPTAIQAEATFKLTGQAVLSLSDLTLIDSMNLTWKNVKSGKRIPGFRLHAVHLKYQLLRFFKKLF